MKKLPIFCGAGTAMITPFIKDGKIDFDSLERLIELMSKNPSERFGLNISLTVGSKANLTVFDLDGEYVINESDFLSMGKSSPFTGDKVYGKCLLTIADGNVAYKNI